MVSTPETVDQDSDIILVNRQICDNRVAKTLDMYREHIEFIIYAQSDLQKRVPKCLFTDPKRYQVNNIKLIFATFIYLQIIGFGIDW